MSNQQVSRLSTVRFSLPENLLESVKNMKIVGRDLLFYVSEEEVGSVTQTCTDMGLSVVDRVFRLHASTQDEATFKRVFGNVDHEMRESQGGRYIATISVDSKEEYDRLLALHGEDAVVKPFKARYSNIKRSDDDDHSDTNERVMEQKQVPVKQTASRPSTGSSKQTTASKQPTASAKSSTTTKSSTAPKSTGKAKTTTTKSKQSNA